MDLRHNERRRIADYLHHFKEFCWKVKKINIVEEKKSFTYYFVVVIEILRCMYADRNDPVGAETFIM